MGLFNGRQTRDIVAFMINRAVAGQGIDLFGYTCDHPVIAESLVRAAREEVFVRLTLNSEEVEGRSNTARATATLLKMMGRCSDAGCGPDSSEACNLDIWKQQGQPVSPVYASWNRTSAARTVGADHQKGALHANMFVIGPSVRGPACDRPHGDDRIVVIGSTNWRT